MNTKEEFTELLEQVESPCKELLHFTTFKKLYLDPWMSEKFETVLPVDYHALLEAGKVKVEAVAETWADEDLEREADKTILPLLKEDQAVEEKRLEEIVNQIQKEDEKKL